MLLRYTETLRVTSPAAVVSYINLFYNGKKRDFPLSVIEKHSLRIIIIDFNSFARSGYVGLHEPIENVGYCLLSRIYYVLYPDSLRLSEFCNIRPLIELCFDKIAWNLCLFKFFNKPIVLVPI